MDSKNTPHKGVHYSIEGGNILYFHRKMHVFQPPTMPPCRYDPPIWGIVRVHLVLARHPPSFILIAAIGKKLIFLLPFPVA